MATSLMSPYIKQIVKNILTIRTILGLPVLVLSKMIYQGDIKLSSKNGINKDNNKSYRNFRSPPYLFHLLTVARSTPR